MFSIRDIVILGPIVASLPFCFARPFVGVLVWTVISLLNPHRFAWGFTSQLPVAQAVAIPTLAGFLLSSPDCRRFFSRNMLLLILLWVWFTVTTLRNTSNPLFEHFAPLTWFRWGFVSKILLMTLLMVAIVNTWRRFRILILVIAGCMGLLVIKGLPFLLISGGSNRMHGPPGTMLADNNDYGLALNMTLPIFFFLARTEPDRRIRHLMAFLLLATIPTIFFTYSRGALLGLGAISLLMLLKSRHRAVLVPVVLLAGLFAVFLTPQKWQNRMDFRQEGTLLDSSARQRIYSWTFAWNLACDNPLTGGGFGTFTPQMYAVYAPPDSVGLKPVGYVHGPHSVYFGVLAEHGFPGLALYLLLTASCYFMLRRLGRYGVENDDALVANYAAMAQFGIIGFLVSGAFLGRAYFDYYFTLIGCALILDRLCRIEAEEDMLAGAEAAA
jgi:probable O-glycosylation ligase (exosortase A-associated)